MSQLPMMEEQQATGKVAQIFDDIRREMELPFVPNIFRASAGSAAVLAGTWEALRNVYLQSTLPMSLKAMILFSIASARQCQYCSSVHQVTCKTLGIEEETLDALVKDLGAISPRRVQEIVKFAVKCADDPINLTEEDYNRVREQGVSDEELMEIIALSAFGVYMDTLAEATKTEVDSAIKQALAG